MSIGEDDEVIDIVVLCVSDVYDEAGEITEAGDSVSLCSEEVESFDREMDIYSVCGVGLSCEFIQWRDAWIGVV